MIDVRLQTPADQADVRRVVEDAFGRSEFGHNGEADIAQEIGVAHGFAGIPQGLFFIKALDPEVMTSGEVALYRPEFGPQGAEA